MAMSLTGKQIGRNKQDFQYRYIIKDQCLILISNMSKEEEDKLRAPFAEEHSTGKKLGFTRE